MARKFALEVWSVPKQGIKAPHVRFLGEARGILTHYGKPPKACPGRAVCKSHLQGQTTWKGYAPGQYWSSGDSLWIPIVIEVSAGLIEITGTIDLRGQVWDLYRAVRKYGSNAIEGKFIRQYDVGDLPKAFDVIGTVQRLYKTDTIEWDVPISNFVRESAEATPETGLVEPKPVIDDTGNLEDARELFKRNVRNFGKMPNGSV